MAYSMNIPKYVKISLDISSRIVKGKYIEGEKIKSRFSLANEYNVSPETVRRSIVMLRDRGIVSSTQKSGIKVLSKDKAKDFVDTFTNSTFTNINSFNSRKKEIKDLLQTHHEIEKKIFDAFDEVLEYATQLRSMSTIDPYEISIPDNSHIINKTIAQSKFWQNTEGTIIAVKTYDKFLLSPGPHYQFKKSDVIFCISSEENYFKMVSYICSSDNSIIE